MQSITFLGVAAPLFSCTLSFSIGTLCIVLGSTTTSGVFSMCFMFWSYEELTCVSFSEVTRNFNWSSFILYVYMILFGKTFRDQLSVLSQFLLYFYIFRLALRIQLDYGKFSQIQDQKFHDWGTLTFVSQIILFSQFESSNFRLVGFRMDSWIPL